MAAKVDRRGFLRFGAAAGAALAAGPFQGFVASAAGASGGGGPNARPPLIPIPDLRDGVVRLWLPDGFSYRSFHDNATNPTFVDGTTLPGRHDGMTCVRRPRGAVTSCATTR